MRPPGIIAGQLRAVSDGRGRAISRTSISPMGGLTRALLTDEVVRWLRTDQGVVVPTHAQRMREDQADRVPRAPVARRARDATAGGP